MTDSRTTDRISDERLAELVREPGLARGNEALSICRELQRLRSSGGASGCQFCGGSQRVANNSPGAPDLPCPNCSAPEPSAEPDPALIDSMAMRYAHNFGLLSPEHQVCIRKTMRQLWEEVTGRGFYRRAPEPSERHAWYAVEGAAEGKWQGLPVKDVICINCGKVRPLLACLNDPTTCSRPCPEPSAKDYIARLPADWFKDSSLETWFPLTAEELKRLRMEVETLRRSPEPRAEFVTGKCVSKRCGGEDLVTFAVPDSSDFELKQAYRITPTKEAKP